MDQKFPTSSNIDDILDELKLRGNTPARVKSQDIDAILAEMGLGSAPVPVRPQAPAPQPQPAPAAESFFASQPAEAPGKPEPTKPAVAPETSVTEPVAPVQPAETAPVEKAPEVLTERTPEAKPEPAAEAPAIPEAPAVSASKAAKKSAHLDSPTIWDIDVYAEHTEIGPRMGKAAALEQAGQNKFAHDEELTRWFTVPEEPEDRHAARQAEKEERRRLAAERKEEKRRARQAKKQNDFDDMAETEENDFYSAFAARYAAEKVESEPEVEIPADTEAEATSFFTKAAVPADDIAPEAIWNETAADNFTPAEALEDEDAFAAKVTDATFGFSAIMAGKSPTPSAITEESAPKTTTTQPDNTESALPANDLFSVKAPSAGDFEPDITRAFSLDAAQEEAAREEKAQAVRMAEAEASTSDDLSDTRKLNVKRSTRSFDIDSLQEEPARVPTAAFTQEFAAGEALHTDENKSLFLDEMVDDRFRDFFSETVAMNSEDIKNSARNRRNRRKKMQSAVVTGEFTKLAEMAEASEYIDPDAEAPAEDEFDDYDHPQDAPAIESDISSLVSTLTRRTLFSFILGVLLLWLGLAFNGTLPIFGFMSFVEAPYVFTVVYLGLLVVAIALNFTTVATGLGGLFGESTTDSAPALATLAALLQGVMLLVNTLTRQSADGTLFASLAVFLLAFNALGKRVRAVSILNNFKLASAGGEHSAAYILDDRNELAFNITKGLEEQDPTLLISRPTTLVKGFLRQSFSQHHADRVGRVLGWVLLSVSLVAGIITFLLANQNLFAAITAFTAVLCIASPFSSSLVSGVPSLLLQRSTARVGAVVPGWSAIEDLGDVNVVMATARDIFPPSAVSLKGIKTFEKERIDLAILYAASVLIEGCDTLRDIFMGVIQGKSDMLYKVESLTKEPGRGFTAWVQNNRVVIGSREMLQKHDITPPPMEVEVKYVPNGHMPVYLAVSGKLFAMFIVGYGADEEVDETLEGLIKSGVSLLVTSDDMNVTSELIEHAYQLPHGVVKVLGRRELDILEPLTSYIPESEGVMTHIGTFSSFIGGMRAAAGCAASERMSTIVQIASVVLACLLCLLLVFSGGLASLSIGIALMYQIAWTLLVSILPFARRY